MDTRILIVGYGRMGQLVERLAPECGCQVAGVLDIDLNAAARACRTARGATWTSPSTSRRHRPSTQNLPRYAALGLNAVVGTTGWNAEREALRHRCEQAGIGVVAAPNFSVGAVLFEAMAAHAAGLLTGQPAFGAWLHEIHHDKKLDAPSGTALGIKAAMEASGYERTIDVAASRAGHVPGRAHRRLRRAVRDHHAVAQRARPGHVRARRAGRRTLGPRQARVVLDAGCAGIAGLR